MSRGTRFLAAIACGVALVGLATVAATAAITRHYGTFDLEVRGKEAGGEHVRIVLPGVLLQAALSLAPRIPVPADAAGEAESLLPVLGEVLGDLERLDDAVFVEARKPGETVSVRKSGRSLVVEVDSSDETVRVSIPIAVARRLVDKLDVTPRDESL